MKTIVRHGVEELINDAEEEFLLGGIFASGKVHLGGTIMTRSRAFSPIVFDLHGCQFRHDKRSLQRNDRFMKSQSRNGRHPVEVKRERNKKKKEEEKSKR